MPLALSLVVLAAVIHASWNLMAKRAAPVGVAFVLAYNLVSCVAYAPWVGWVLARGGMAWSADVLACIVASGLVHLGYSLCLQRGYQLAELSVVYPVARGSGPLLSTLAAVLLLGEVWTPARALGLAAVVAGIGLIATRGRLAAFRTRGGQAGIRWGLATGGLIACYTIIDAYGVKVLGIAPVVLDWFGSTLRLALLVPMVAPRGRQGWAAMRGHWPLAAGVGLLSPLAYILVLVALGMGAPVSVVAPMREMSMMVGALLGLLVLREPVGPARLAGCAVLVAGVLLLGR
ncbi:DMT family transporter [Amaricoccus sp.]|uniref:DMT family transporter n=1 Tax=Amaricoccus sp. TaxID=1872485 RepID=UPI00262D098C|nr:DMT family transporter [Amaricoccus sp.]HRO12143.1 DMT family transporter [Amaricoccus sp.]